MKINSDHCKNNDSKKRPGCHIQNITQKNIDIKGYYAKVNNFLKSRNIKWFLLNYQYYRYLYNTILKSFKNTGCFNLVEENRLEHLFSGDLVQTAYKASTTCDENIAQLSRYGHLHRGGSMEPSSVKRAKSSRGYETG